MKLVYTVIEGQREVAIGDVVSLDGESYTVGYFRQPHKPSSEGKVTIHRDGDPRMAREYYVSVIGAKWIDREDRV